MTSPRKKRRRSLTLEDVAREAGVSRALVSIVLRDAPGASPATRERVLRIADELGYRPDARARQLARRTSQLLGVVYSVQSAFHADLLPPIYRSAEAADYEVVLSGKTSASAEQRAIDTLLGYRCDGLLLLGSDLSEEAIRTITTALPVVIVTRRLADETTLADSVRTDDSAAMRLAVDHLVALGHRSIAHVDGGPGIKGSDRRRAYRAAMTEAGLAEHIDIVAGGQTWEEGYRAGTALLSETHLPSAAISYNDDSAWGLVRALHDAGLSVPEHMSVVGYDASRLWQQVPKNLTSIAQDSEALATLGVERALERLHGYEGDDREIVLPPTLTIGRTTARTSVRGRGAETIETQVVSGQAEVVSGSGPSDRAPSARQ